jgi:hypothetical protein
MAHADSATPAPRASSYGGRFRLATQVGRVPSMVVPLDREQELRYERLMDGLLMLDMHQHVQVLPEPMTDLFEYARDRQYAWGYEAARAGGWSTVTTANGLSTIGFPRELSFVDFDDLVMEISLMLADVALFVWAMPKRTPTRVMGDRSWVFGGTVPPLVPHHLSPNT